MFVERESKMKIAIYLTFAFLSIVTVAQTDDSVHVDSNLSFMSTLDDTTDVNLFGADSQIKNCG